MVHPDGKHLWGMGHTHRHHLDGEHLDGGVGVQCTTYALSSWGIQEADPSWEVGHSLDGSTSHRSAEVVHNCTQMAHPTQRVGSYRVHRGPQVDEVVSFLE